ncbi:hypothetical protein [Streptomyces pseudogriseolus]
MKSNLNSLAVLADAGDMSKPDDRKAVSQKLGETNRRSSNPRPGERR